MPQDGCGSYNSLNNSRSIGMNTYERLYGRLCAKKAIAIVYSRCLAAGVKPCLNKATIPWQHPSRQKPKGLSTQNNVDVSTNNHNHGS